MTQYVKVNFDTYIKEVDLIKAVIIKNPVPENVIPVKTLNDFVKDTLKDKKKHKALISTILPNNSKSNSISYGFIIKKLDCS